MRPVMSFVTIKTRIFVTNYINKEVKAQGGTFTSHDRMNLGRSHDNIFESRNIKDILNMKR